MKLSEKGISLLKHHEGFRGTMYYDAAGLPTIGYGTLIDTPEEQYLKTASISEAQATDLLKNQVKRFENAVNKGVKVALSQSQFDALVLFAYNVGEAAFLKSSLLKKVNEKQPLEKIKEEFLKWITAGGNKLQGLVNRRLSEFELFASPEKKKS